MSDEPSPLTAEEIIFAAIPEHIWQGDPGTRNQRRRDLAKRIVDALEAASQEKPRAYASKMDEYQGRGA